MDGADEIAVGIQSAAIEVDHGDGDESESIRNRSDKSQNKVRQRLQEFQTLTQMPSIQRESEGTKDEVIGQYEQQQIALPIS